MFSVAFNSSEQMDTTMKRTSDNTDRIVYRTLSRSHILLAYCFPSEGFLVASNATCECSAHQSFDISPLCNHLFTLLTSVSDWETDLTSVDAALCTKLHAWPLCTPRGVHYGVQVIAPTRRYDRRPPLTAVIMSICSHNSTLSHCLLILATPSIIVLFLTTSLTRLVIRQTFHAIIRHHQPPKIAFRNFYMADCRTTA